MASTSLQQKWMLDAHQAPIIYLTHTHMIAILCLFFKLALQQDMLLRLIV